MKIKAIITFVILTMNVMAQDVSENKVGPKGGVIKYVQGYNIEMINSIRYLSVYLYDKNLNSIPNDGILSEVIFCYAYDECLNKPLNPNGKYGFIVNIANPDYNYCDINLIINGKFISAKFDNVIGLTDKGNRK